jgi:hypothetical protein
VPSLIRSNPANADFSFTLTPSQEHLIMALQNKAFTLGNIAARVESLDYHTSPVQITNEGDSDLTINAGDPLTATGIATDANGLLGLATDFHMIRAGETDEMTVLDFRYGYGVILNGSMLPDTVTEPIRAALTGKGFKILP